MINVYFLPAISIYSEADSYENKEDHQIRGFCLDAEFTSVGLFST